MKFDILIAGVGGQGQVLASRLIGAAAISAGFFVRTGETIGMSQRGGCVVSHVRIGDSCMSPAVPSGKADLIIGFEICEAARNLCRLAPEGKLILNDQIINPVPVSLGMQKYDAQGMKERIKGRVPLYLMVDGGALAARAGSVKACNVVLLGAAAGAGYMPMEKEIFKKAIYDVVPEKFRDLNDRAFDYGYDFARSVRDDSGRF